MNKFKTLIIKAFNDGVAVLKLDKNKMSALAVDENATKVGMVIMVIPFVLNMILLSLSSIVSSGFFFFLYLKISLISLITSVGSIFILGFVAQTVFHSKNTIWGLFRIVSHAGILMILTVLPFLLGLFGGLGATGLSGLINFGAAIWMMVVVYNALLHHFKMEKTNAVLTIVISAVAIVILQSILGRILVGPFYRIMY